MDQNPDTGRKLVKSHVPADVHARLTTYAAETHRSLARALEHLVVTGLDSHDAEQGR